MPRTILLAAMISGVAATANAEVPETAIVRCAGVLADAERLACYDAIADGVSAARSASEQRRRIASEVAAKARAEAAAAEQQAATEAKARKIESFGAETAGRRSEPTDDKLDQVSSEIADVFTGSFGTNALLLDNGQIWKILDDGVPILKRGDSLIIKRGALGSYRAVIDRINRTMRVSRLK